MSRPIRRLWLVYRNDHAPVERVRHLRCEACRGETECGLSIGDYRRFAFTDVQQWWTEKTVNYRIPACAECVETREWKLERGYRGREAS